MSEPAVGAMRGAFTEAGPENRTRHPTHGMARSTSSRAQGCAAATAASSLALLLVLISRTHCQMSPFFLKMAK